MTDRRADDTRVKPPPDTVVAPIGDGGAVTRPEDDRDVLERVDEEPDRPVSGDSLPLEAEPADVWEQARSLPADDDDYR
jgi:hypothetical protein